MGAVSKSPKFMLLALLAGTATVSLAAQAQDAPASDNVIVNGQLMPDLAQMAKGPEIEGIISARSDGSMQVTTADGADTTIALVDATRIKGSGGFLGLSSDKLAADSLLNGLPVSVETL